MITETVMQHLSPRAQHEHLKSTRLAVLRALLVAHLQHGGQRQALMAKRRNPPRLHTLLEVDGVAGSAAHDELPVHKEACSSISNFPFLWLEFHPFCMVIWTCLHLQQHTIPYIHIIGWFIYIRFQAFVVSFPFVSLHPNFQIDHLPIFTPFAQTSYAMWIWLRIVSNRFS